MASLSRLAHVFCCVSIQGLHLAEDMVYPAHKDSLLRGLRRLEGWTVIRLCGLQRILVIGLTSSSQPCCCCLATELQLDTSKKFEFPLIFFSTCNIGLVEAWYSSVRLLVAYWCQYLFEVQWILVPRRVSPWEPLFLWDGRTFEGGFEMGQPVFQCSLRRMEPLN